MRIITVAANLAQMIIILVVFLFKGLSLGSWVILALFVLLMIAFVNLLMLLYHSALSDKDPGKRTKEKAALIKRQDLRVAYLSEPFPVLMVGKRNFAVSDLSENGLRIRIGRHEKLKRRFRGHLALLCDQSIGVQAVLIRRQGDEAALALKQPLDYAVLVKEKQHAIRE